MSDDSKARGVQGFVVGALIAGTIALGFFLSKPADPAPAVTPPPFVAAPPQEPVQPASPSSPREAADLLFNEAMMASEQNDRATLDSVLPGAIAAYRALGELDDDGRYHLALLELAGGKLAEARASCERMLSRNPNHLLALGVSIRAAVKAGDSAAARALGQRFLAAYDAESVRPLPEYQDHQRMFPTYRAEAMVVVR